jgi:hypothetical protein
MYEYQVPCDAVINSDPDASEIIRPHSFYLISLQKILPNVYCASYRKNHLNKSICFQKCVTVKRDIGT